MTETRQLVKFSIVYKGEFNFVSLYKLVREWVLENGYGPDKWLEKLYLQRDGGGASEHWIWWRTTKTINDYVVYRLDINFHTMNLKPVEIVHEGNKIKTNNGEVEVFFDVKLVLDPDNKWDNHWLLKQKSIKDWWLKKVFKPEIDKHEEILIIDANRAQSVVKQYLDLKGFMSEYSGELFHPVKGFE